jgi:hypothetical protein
LFIKIYAKLLDLNYEMLIAIYKRDIENISMKRKINIVNEIDIKEEETKKSNFKNFIEYIKDINYLKITPRKVAVIFSFFIILFFGSYIYSTIKSAFNKPDLRIDSPLTVSGEYAGNLEYFDNKVIIKGKTESGTTIKINEIPIFLKPDYAFESSEIPLPNDSNKIIIVAQNNFGTKTTIDLNLIKPVKNIKLMQASISVNANTNLKIEINGEVRLEREVFASEILSFDSTETLKIEITDPNAIALKINQEEYKLNSPNVLFTNLKTEIKQEDVSIPTIDKTSEDSN